MNLDGIQVGIIDWSQVSASVRWGITGSETSRSRKLGNIQMRLVEYSPHYVAGDWCAKGHIVYVVAGEMTVLFSDETKHKLVQGMSFHVADNVQHQHRVMTFDKGATAFIVD
jgi:quercetin dioxygenase-like cupin family protein